MSNSKNVKQVPNFDYKSIKSFEDACAKLALDPSTLPEVSLLPEEMRKAIVNVYKLFVIFKAINNGWIPNWNDSNQHKYFPWFRIQASPALSSGFGFSGSYCSYVDSISCVGSRLCTDSPEKAIYIAETFHDEYKEFILYLE